MDAQNLLAVQLSEAGVNENPPKPPVAITKNLPPPMTRDTVVRTSIEIKSDMGELTAAMTYEAEAAGERPAARVAVVQRTVHEALSKLEKYSSLDG
ncbi:hypothetical protein E8E14_014699 [Neopestalotiopsis sp. 37M]|nr:hypothetical protein E8E14_014699 [Neopestalotiopsis sp. 37M]